MPHLLGRELLEREVAARAEHKTPESVRTTCSFARAERLLSGEYHGRFLIELLQNAADAWRKDPRSVSSRSRVHVLVTSEPALVVANQGITLTPDVVVESLGHIGASTKSEGESIGHKGIGFKSVLEMTSRPEVYSGLQNSAPTLAVRFDPAQALSRIKDASARWDEFIAGAQGLDANDPLASIPILRYPLWVDDPPDEVVRLAAAGYDTVVRLPFDPEFACRRGMPEDSWISSVRRSLSQDLSDQILLLLGTFSEIVVENQLDDLSPVTIRPTLIGGHAQQVPAANGESVRIERSGATPTYWRVYRREISGEKDLAGEIAVGLRYESGEVNGALVPAVDGTLSTPFHLFFPTRIPSGLPFLLHGYFQVDASRKGFHGAAQPNNQRILDELAHLVRDVVRSASHDSGLESASLVNLVAACPEPEDSLAKAFQASVLGLLDEEEWIPAQAMDGRQRNARPRSFFVDSPRLTRMIDEVFPAWYVTERTGLALSHPQLEDAAIHLIGKRQVGENGDLWDVLAKLFRPGELDVWSPSSSDDGFRKLLALVNWLLGEFPTRTEAFLADLQGDEASRLLPVVSDSGGRRLLPIPDPSGGAPGRRSQLVMARVRAGGGGDLVPPPLLEVSFLPDGLLENEQDVGQARALGIRPFTVDNVLDRLNGIGEAPECAEAVLSFVWKFLARERRNQYGTRKVAERSAVFNPADWFWCRPGRARESGTRRLEQQRERYLSRVLLPARNGSWHAASELAFGTDWADWLTSHSHGWSESAAQSRRVEAYRALEAVCPDPGDRLLASPEQVLSRFEKVDVRVPQATDLAEEWDSDGAEDEVEEELDDAAWDRERHAFLLRLGVWEVLPLEAFESREWRGERLPFPWNGTVADQQRQLSTQDGEWTFGRDGWRGTKHSKVFLGEDYRFQWSLGAAATRNPAATATLLRVGTPLYETRLNATVFCPSCTDRDANTWHSAPRQSSSTDGYPSSLAIQLRSEGWVPVLRAGEPGLEPAEPTQAWWLEKPPTGPGIATSAWRFVPICAPSTGITEELRRIARVNTLDDAGAAELLQLLRDVRRRYETNEIDLTKPTDRRSFVSLHTMIYERLAELPSSDGRNVLEQTGVLCTIGDSLVFSTVSDARHDDGAYSSYIRHFIDRVSLAVVARDRTRTAERLGIEKLAIALRREGEDEGTDVTDELTGMLAARMPELLAILVHHSLGSQTLTLDSDSFRRRAQRLRRLTVRKVHDLVIHASIAGMDDVVGLGARTTGDLFLQGGTTDSPVLFHDFDGDGWQDRLRRKIAPHLAAVLDASPYVHTFALFLQAEGDDEREEFLLELGISDEDVASIASQLGVVSETDRASQRRWYTALLQTLGQTVPPEQLDHDSLELALHNTGASAEVVRRVILSGGGDDVRADTQPGSVLRVLHASGLDLERLHIALRALSPDDGLNISDTRRAFQNWKRRHERRVVAVRARTVGVDQAKAEIRDLATPAHLAWALDVPLADVLVCVASLVAPDGNGVAEQLAEDPVGTLMRLGGFATPADLDAAAVQHYNVEELRRALSLRAARWRNQIQRLAVLIRMTATDTRSGIRAHDEAVREALNTDLHKPSDLSGSVEVLFYSHDRLRERLLAKLDDAVLGPEPDEAEMLAWIHDAGIDSVRIAKYESALSEPKQRTARLKARVGRLADARVTAMIPVGLVAPKGPKPSVDAPDAGDSPTSSPIKVSKIKVGSTFDQRKRELGDEGEQWALADAVGRFLAMSDENRAQAIEGVRTLLSLFDPDATRGLLKHISAAAAPRQDQEDDELVAALEGLLHVSRQYDGFGFDLIGWAAPDPESPAQAMCMEVKSTMGGGFHLSRNEWNTARELVTKDAANRYAVLAVRRGKAGEVPIRMDLLVDPVGLNEAGLLALDTDGYMATYATLA